MIRPTLCLIGALVMTLIVACEPAPSCIDIAEQSITLRKGPPPDIGILHARTCGMTVDGAVISWESSINSQAFHVVGLGDSAIVYSLENETTKADSIVITSQQLRATLPIFVRSEIAAHDLTGPRNCESWTTIGLGISVSGRLQTDDCWWFRTPHVRFGDQYQFQSAGGLHRFTAILTRTPPLGRIPRAIRLDVHPALPSNGIGWDNFEILSGDSVSVRTLTNPGLKRIRIEEMEGRLVEYRIVGVTDDGTKDCTPVVADLNTKQSMVFPALVDCKTGNPEDPYQSFRIELPPDASVRMKVICEGFSLTARISDLGGRTLPFDAARSTNTTSDSIEIQYPSPSLASTSQRYFALELRPGPAKSVGKYRIEFIRIGGAN